MTGCNVIAMPMSAEFMTGRVAADEMTSIHAAIHTIQNIKPISEFTDIEAKILYKAMNFLIGKTKPEQIGRAHV